jgi:hypothetical protein
MSAGGLCVLSTPVGARARAVLLSSLLATQPQNRRQLIPQCLSLKFFVSAWFKPYIFLKLSLYHYFIIRHIDIIKFQVLILLLLSNN